MEDLIKRAEALDALDHERKVLIEQERFGAEHIVVHHARRPIEDLPAVDAAPVVRCRDCKHRPTDNRVRDNDSTGFAIEFPDSSCPCQCEDGWYNWYPDDDWFCGNGERRDEGAAD
jgi:hypothetical protein